MLRAMRPRQSSRREFLQQAAGVAAAGLAVELGGPVHLSWGQAQDLPIGLTYSPADAVASSQPVQWALKLLQKSLEDRGIRVVSGTAGAPTTPVRLQIWASGPEAAQMPATARGNLKLPTTGESLAMVPVSGQAAGPDALWAVGRDERGLVYALTDLADRVDYAANPVETLTSIRPTVETPANSIRSVMRMFSSDVEDKSWFNDKAFWQKYLTMLAKNRFNRINFTMGLGYDFARDMLDTYFYFAYPFLVNVPGYNVKARGLPDSERDQNLAMLKFISDGAAARGLHFQLGVWTHAYTWTNSPRVNYVIDGLDDKTHASYSRDAMTLLLRSCPNIKGVTIRTHGESGVAEGNYDFWKTIFGGVKAAAVDGRKLEIDLHAKGIDQKMIDGALETGLPVNVSPKFWAEHLGLPYHQAAIRENEMPRNDAGGLMSLSTGSRNHTRYGYADLLCESRKYGLINRIWPGTQRVLLSGDPAFIAGCARQCSFGGMLGGEWMEPLSFKGRKGSGLPGGRDGYADATLKTGSDWEKYSYAYRLWGRLMFNPDADAEVWRRQLQKEFAGAAQQVESALAKSSRILPLVTTAHDPSAANNNYWPEIYTNMSIVDASSSAPYSDTPTPRVFGTVSPLDPQLFATVNECAAALLSGQPMLKITPLEVAKQLEEWASASTSDLNRAAQAADTKSPAYRRLTTDVAIANGLGRFFAAKFRAGVLFEIFNRSGDAAAKTAAMAAYSQARDIWAELSAAASVYRDDITYGVDAHSRGHWRVRLAAIDRDIAAMRARDATSVQAGVTSQLVAAALAAVTATTARGDSPLDHNQPPRFTPGMPLQVRISPAAGSADVANARLWYRRLNQAERWQSAPMTREGAAFQASVPGEYTKSDYPMQYYFEFNSTTGAPCIWPGFTKDFVGQPYFVVRAG